MAAPTPEQKTPTIQPTPVRFDNHLASASQCYGDALLDKESDYTLSQMYEMDTRDHADHTFCGIMFNVANTSTQPLEYLEIQAIAVRGNLGPLTVWMTKDTYHHKHESADAWQEVYHGTHSRSRQSYTRLTFHTPVRLKSGESCGMYVHSALVGDQAIVYDNRRGGVVTMKDTNICVESGMAHLSNRPFSANGMYGFAWRKNRQFVGRICYGVKYLLWQPSQSIHDQFPKSFRQAVDVLLLIDYKNYRLSKLPEHVIWYVINFLPYNWVQDGKDDSNASINTGLRASFSSMRKSVCRQSRSCAVS